MSLSARLNKHMVAAAAVAAGAAATANAAIVYSGIINITIPATFAGLYLNVENGVNSTVNGTSAPGWDINPYGNGYLRWFNPTGGGYVRQNAGQTFAGNLTFGQDISGASLYTTGITQSVVGVNPGEWQLNADNLVGFKFTNGASQLRYGWARVNLGANISTRKIVDWAYEDSGAGIGAGIVPAPGALALLGLAGFAGRRRRA